MFKKEYLYDFIEKGYSEKNFYNLAVSKLIKRLRISGNIDMADIIRNIQLNNSKSLKTKVIRINHLRESNFKNYNHSIGRKANLIIDGYNLSIINSALLYGKPGTGKTIFVNKLGKASKLDIVSMDLSSILDFRFGESIKKLENFIKENKDKKQIIFFDEADSIFSKRGNFSDVFETSRIITTMLQLLDQPRKALIIFSTNLIMFLDKAIIRRFDVMVDFNKNLNQELKIQIIEEFLTNWNISLSNNEMKELNKHILSEYINISDLKLISKRIAIWKKINGGGNLKEIMLNIKKEIAIQKTSETSLQSEGK